MKQPIDTCCWCQYCILPYNFVQGKSSRAHGSAAAPIPGAPPAPWCAPSVYLATVVTHAEPSNQVTVGTDAFVPAALVPNVERLLQVSNQQQQQSSINQAVNQAVKESVNQSIS